MIKGFCCEEDLCSKRSLTQSTHFSTANQRLGRRLKECRLQALRTLHKSIAQKYSGKTAPQSYYQKLIEHYTEQTEMKSPYSGILIY